MFEELSAEEQLEITDSSTPVTIPITVHDVKTCPITFYERFPALSTLLVRKVQASARFQVQEESPLVTSAKRILSRAFPVLDKGRYGFNWPAVHDYFICRKAHNLSVLPELRHLESLVDHHYIFRYSMYFRDPEHLTLFTLPILRKLMGDIQRAASVAQQSPSTATSDSSSTPPAAVSTLSLYSSHDITLYGLLHVLGAEQAVRNWEVIQSEWRRVSADRHLNPDPSDGSQREITVSSDSSCQMAPLYWPYYGSNLVFEALVDSSVADNASTASLGVASELDDTRVQVFLDMKPLRLNLAYIDQLIAEHDAGGDDTERISSRKQAASLMDTRYAAKKYCFIRAGPSRQVCLTVRFEDRVGVSKLTCLFPSTAPFRTGSATVEGGVLIAGAISLADCVASALSRSSSACTCGAAGRATLWTSEWSAEERAVPSVTLCLGVVSEHGRSHTYAVMVRVLCPFAREAGW
eukprot:gene22706-28859_t